MNRIVHFGSEQLDHLHWYISICGSSTVVGVEPPGSMSGWGRMRRGVRRRRCCHGRLGAERGLCAHLQHIVPQNGQRGRVVRSRRKRLQRNVQRMTAVTLAVARVLLHSFAFTFTTLRHSRRPRMSPLSTACITISFTVHLWAALCLTPTRSLCIVLCGESLIAVWLRDYNGTTERQSAPKTPSRTNYTIRTQIIIYNCNHGRRQYT